MEKLKERQREENNLTFGKNSVMTYEQNYYHDFFREIPFKKIHKMLSRAHIDLNGRRVLVASCGTGIDVYYLKKEYSAQFFVSDLSEKAVQLVTNTFSDVDGAVEDNEDLSFEDGTFDYSFIAAALHHLPRPTLGLYELLRVSKNGLIVIEPNDSLITRIATNLGLAAKIESEGNYVYRFSKREVEKIASSLFCEYAVLRFWAIHRIAKSSLEFFILRVLNVLLNLVIPKQGNYIVFYILKSDFAK